MKAILYTILILSVVPLQSIVLPHASVWNVMPDMGLVAVCLVGLLAGELDGVLMGLAVGWAMSLFSAGDAMTSIVTKGMAGLLAGLAGRQMAQITPMVLVAGLFVVSCLAGLATVGSVKLAEDRDMWWALRTVILPQACFDAVAGGVLYWAAWNWFDVERLLKESRA